MSQIRVCFLGTPEFAEVHLASLLKNSKFQVTGVVTQPDRPAGRKMQLTPTPVKVLALQNQIPVLTPENLKREPELMKQILAWQADVAVVVAFGQILSQEFLDSFKFGAVNVHGSLLPRWRGAAPIQRSLEAGDAETGVSLQKMVKKLDAGPVIAERKIKLDDEINATALYNDLAQLGTELLTEDLPRYISGELQPKEQDEAQVSFAPKIEKSESLLQFDQSAVQLHNRVRAFTMGPGTHITFQGKRLKIHRTKVLVASDESSKTADGVRAAKPGCIYNLNSESLSLYCGEGVLQLLDVQPESKPKMTIGEFIRSQSLLERFKKGDLFE